MPGPMFVHEPEILLYFPARDIKPANLLMGQDGVVRITDFGIAANLEELEGSCQPDAESIKTHGKPSGGFHKKFMVGLKHPQRQSVILRYHCLLWSSDLQHSTISRIPWFLSYDPLQMLASYLNAGSPRMVMMF